METAKLPLHCELLFIVHDPPQQVIQPFLRLCRDCLDSFPDPLVQIKPYPLLVRVQHVFVDVLQANHARVKPSVPIQREVSHNNWLTEGRKWLIMILWEGRESQLDRHLCLCLHLPG